MSPRKKAQLAFASAVMLLVLSGLAAYVTIYHLLDSEKWVIHSLEVRAAIGDLDSSFARAARARSGYVISGSDDYLSLFDSALPEISRRSQQLRDLVRDNRRQQELCAQLEDVMARRVTQLRESIHLEKQSPKNQQGQAELDRQGITLAAEMTSVMQQMRGQEDELLVSRGKAAHRLFVLTVVILMVTFILALELLAVHFRLLSTELGAREAAEQSARHSEESLRRLTGRLLQLQDAERRKFSRELHDSLGQYLVGVKMNLEMFASQPKESLLAEATQLLDQSIAETRTISHLLHPPLLDEAGLSSAAKWYLEGFAQRSGIEVKLDLPDDAIRLPKAVALALFRILQESLTNIHRHSGSAKAEVGLQLLPDHVLLTVRDYGKGISPELLESLQTNGANAGVGLAGMRERIRELGGQLRVEACSPGTLVAVTMPLAETAHGTSAKAAD
ncbi:MAG: CHASE3 domain-containing protein [Acidobacteriia bacterium]|nr:CHASE3 domain-containing protein [Terriglobia bacterium]